jgi:hypothetical protein
MKKYFLIAIMIFLLSGCSWQEYFVISNETNADITVEYKLAAVVHGFAIFNQTPTVYAQDISGNIDWERKISIVDKDTSLDVVKVVLPAKSTLIFGRLSNDKYEKYNQYFINSRVFNLTSVSIINNGNITEIRPENFDNFFVKKNGIIRYKSEK